MIKGGCWGVGRGGGGKFSSGKGGCCLICFNRLYGGGNCLG